MKFCNHCGSPVDLQIPEGDHLPRHVCNDCGLIHYQNPKIVAGCIPEWQDSILRCRRAIEPKRGLWTIPSGFMETGETLEEAAKRETHEEACAQVEITGLYSVFSLPHISQVYVVFRAKLVDDYFAPGLESLETTLFKERQIPWDEIAFPVVTRSLRRYFEERPNQKFTTFIDTITPHC
jgi:ADP-ribose pyrophosphatase YjhB (NUDIX family)